MSFILSKTPKMSYNNTVLEVYSEKGDFLCFSAEEAVQQELASNKVFQKTGDEVWKKIGDVAYAAFNKKEYKMITVPDYIFAQLPLKHWECYK